MLALFKLTAFADKNFNVAQMVQFFLDFAENIVGKGENVSHQHCLLFQQCFQKAAWGCWGIPTLKIQFLIVLSWKPK